jgi:hypothetical protein
VQDLRDFDLQEIQRRNARDLRLARAFHQVQAQEEERRSAMDVDVQANLCLAAQMLRDDEADEANRQAEVSERICPWDVRPAHPRPHCMLQPTGDAEGLVRFPRAKHTRANTLHAYARAHCTATRLGGRALMQLLELRTTIIGMQASGRTHEVIEGELKYGPLAQQQSM